MAHFIRILKAKTIKNKFLHYQEEKEIRLNKCESDFESFKKRKVKGKFQKWWLTRFVNQIKRPNTAENVVCKSFLGFMGGVVLTYIFFLFLRMAVNSSLKSSTYMCGLIGIVLCLGLAFSSIVRCYVLLLLPVFFSKQGRQALLAYALFLAFTGPARNTMHNMEILSESMTCGQEMVKRTLKQIIEMVKVPFRSVKETLENLSKAVKEVIESVKSFVMKIKRIIVNILKVIKLATTWLGSIVNFCNKKVGTPFQRCMQTFDDAITDCKAKLGVLDFLCHVVHIVKALCYTVKWMDFICLFTEFVSEKAIETVKKRLREFGLRMKNLFHVSIEFTHSYEFETTASNSMKEVSKTVLQKISKKVEKLQNIFSFCGFMFSLFFILVFFKVYYYKYKFLSSDRYDNIYINKYIVELDIKRAQMDRETVLPLEPKEKKKYAKPTTIRLLKDERTRIGQSMFLLSLTSFKIITFIIVDYSLFWTLMKIYEAGRNALLEAEKSEIKLHVEGRGILSNFYRKLGNTMQIPENPNIHLNPLHCLPDPTEPDMRRYIQIGVLVALCWVLTVTEAYGLRLRNIVMSHYYPDRARERAVWLYNHILRTRSSFLRFARRQLRRKFGVTGSGKHIEQVTLFQRLFANFPIPRVIFRGKNDICLICEAPETRTERLKRCRTPDCQGRYCLKCFASLENVCTICQHPIEYGDISDISEEVDSSEEDFYIKYENEFYSDVPQESNKFLTFKDMEIREKFRDVEAHKVPDYAKLGDLYHDKQALQRRLKEVLQRHIQAIEDENNRKSQVKVNEYKQIRSKLQFMISNLRKKKQERKASKTSALRKKFEEKLNNLRKFKESQAEESEKLLGENSTPTRSKVSFKLEENEKLRTDYKRLMNEIRAKIKQKKNRSLNCQSSQSTTGMSSSHSQEKRGAEKKSPSEDSHKNNFMTYYFVEKEKKIDFYTPQPWFDGKSNLNICFRLSKKRKLGDKDFIFY